mgnify:CR=1 FL=1
MLKKRQKEEPGINSSSMADVVFILLVFFLVTTTIDMQKGLDITLPEEQSDFVKLPKENICNLLISEFGTIMLDNEAVEVHEIADIIKGKIDANPNLVVSLKTVRRTKYNDYIRVFDQLRMANAKKISIAEPDEAD